jgi:hypothetical protein
VNDASGARSQLAGLVTAGVVALTLLVLAPAFSDLPLAVLGGIVLMVALAGPLGGRAGPAVPDARRRGRGLPVPFVTGAAHTYE